MTAAPTVARLLAEATRRLAASASARLDAEVLLASVLDAPRSALYRAPERELDAVLAARFAALVAARVRGCPLPYLTGRAEFWSLPLAVTDAVLVPRPETELVVETALACALPAGRATVADLGTGSGAIACAYAHERPHAAVLATDRSLAALACARRNVVALGCRHVMLVAADWLAACAPASLDLVMANPPYVGRAEARTLGAELAHEPAAALFAGDDGLADLARIIADAPRVLRAGGHAVLEHGAGQGAAVRRLFATHGYGDIATRRDLAGHERVTRATR